MSVSLIAFLSSLLLAALILAATGLPVLATGISLRRRARAIETHPTIVAAARLKAVAEQLQTLAPRIQRISDRSARIRETATALVASSALLRLQVDRIAFATRLLLETLVPTLRGCMMDPAPPNA